MKSHIDAYLKAHETVWAPSTMKSERSRLAQLAPLLHLEPLELFMELMKMKKPYTIKTTFIRLAKMEQWAKLEPRYAKFMRTHVRRFGNQYAPEQIKVTFEEAQERIKTLKGATRLHATGLLQSGVRLSESYDIEDGQVRGKGGRIRKTYAKIKATVPKTTLARALKAVGLKPHTLRKLCATRLVERGATAADLCRVFGWQDISTAFFYLQSKDDKKLESLMETPKEGS